MGKIVENPHYHVWTDALHGRQLAREAKNKWDAGTYARWSLFSSWTALEIACQLALDDVSISYSFKQNIDEAMLNKGVTPPIMWGEGLWQKVTMIQTRRKEFTHQIIGKDQLVTDVQVSENAILVIRDAIKDIYKRCGKIYPAWIDDDSDSGFDHGAPQFSATLSCDYYDPQAPDAIFVSFVLDGREHHYATYSPTESLEPIFNDIVKNTHRPVSKVIAKQFGNILREKDFSTRGS